MTTTTLKKGLNKANGRINSAVLLKAIYSIMYRKKILSLLFICLSFHFTQVSAQVTPTGLYTFGGKADDHFGDFTQTFDTGYCIIGTTNSFGKSGGIYIIKLDKNIKTQWTKIYGDTNFHGYSIIQTTDTGYAICGWAPVGSPSHDAIFLAKLNRYGDTLWTRTYGGNGQPYYNYTLQQTSDHGIVITGFSWIASAPNYSSFVMKFDTKGNLEWKQILNNPHVNGGLNYVDILAGTDNALYITGYIDSMSGAYWNWNMVVTKIDSAGSVKWFKKIGGANNKLGEEGLRIIETNNHCFILAGTSSNFGNNTYINNNDIYIVKIDANGNLLWTRTIGGTRDESPSSIIQTRDNGFLINGRTKSYSDTLNGEACLIKLDTAGNLQWMKIFGRKITGTCTTLTKSVETLDKGYMLFGETSTYGNGNADIMVAKLDSNGNNCIMNAVNVSPVQKSGGSIENVSFLNVTEGSFLSPAKPLTMSSADSSSIQCITTGILPDKLPGQFGVMVFPNPSTGIVTFEQNITKESTVIEVYNPLGEKVYTTNLNTNHALINLSGRAPGIYFYRILTTTGNFVSGGKFLLQN